MDTLGYIYHCALLTTKYVILYNEETMCKFYALTSQKR